VPKSIYARSYLRRPAYYMPKHPVYPRCAGFNYLPRTARLHTRSPISAVQLGTGKIE